MNTRVAIGYVLTVAIVLAAVPIYLLAGEPKPFRIIPIPHEQGFYSLIPSMVISSQKELNHFLVKYQGVGPDLGYDQQGFIEAITAAKIDFNREALVLLQHTEGSGTPQVTFAEPMLKAHRLICRIEVESVQEGNCMMAYYCFALAVSKEQIREVEQQYNQASVDPSKIRTIILKIKK
jgi:hypothetical protein